MPTDERVDKALELVQKGAGNYQYFFEKLASPAWIRPLAQRGRFRHPPAVEHIENMMRLPPWPEGEYLLRMAQEAPNEVAAAIDPVCFESDNSRVHQLLVEIAAKLPPALASKLAVRETEWVKQQRSMFTLYPEKAASLVVHLAEGGEGNVALGLTSAILEVREPDKAGEARVIEGDDSSTRLWRPSPEPESKIEPVWSQAFLRKVTEQLSLAEPDQFLASLARNLDRAVSIHCSNYEIRTEDHSTIWRPHLEHNSHYGTLDECVSALTGTIKFLGSQDRDYTARILEALAPYTWPVFDRLRAFTFLHAVHPDPAQIAEFVRDAGHYESASENPEFAKLLKKWANALPAATLEEVLRRIDAGPDLTKYAHYLEHRIQPENVDAARTKIVERWQLGWLIALGSALDEARTQELNQLLEKYGTPQPDFRSHGARLVQDQSPADLDAFKQMSAAELVGYLKGWTPPSNGIPFEQPSRAGMAAPLREWVADDPQHASEVVDTFLTTDLDPVYISALLDAFSGVLKSERSFDVYAVARAAQWVAEHTDALNDAKSDGWHEATWNWAHMSAARFMADLMLQEKRLDIARAAELFPTVRALCFLPRPTVDDEVEYKRDASRFAFAALNTPRPVGIEAMIRYGRWIKLATPDAQFTPALLAPVFEVLERKLDPKEDPSAAVREMFGMQFRLLAWLDLEWFSSVMPKLFPGKNERTLDRFAWNAYLQYGGPVVAMLPATRDRYLAAVTALQKGEDVVREIDRTLASHLMQYYAHGAIELDDPLLVQFFNCASVKLRAQAVGDIGWNLGQKSPPLTPELQARLMRLWESRMALLGAGSKVDADELGTFGWWLASKKFPEEWAVHQAMPILEYLRSLRPDFAAVEAFAALAPRFPYEAVRVVHVLFQEDRDGWSIHGWSEHLRDILLRALNDGDGARREAQQMIELLVSKGFREYRNLTSNN